MNLSRQRGVSLIQILVALVISTFLMWGMVGILTSGKRSFVYQSDIAAMQDSARFGMKQMVQAIRMGGHRGGLWKGVVNVIAGGTAQLPCQGGWIAAYTKAVEGFSGSSAIAGTSTCVSAFTGSNILADSDVLVVRYAGAEHVADPGSVANTNRYFLYAVTGLNAELNTGSGVASTWSTEVAATPSGRVYGRYIFPYYADLFYVRSCSDCDGGGDGIPTLVRMRMDGNSVTTEPLAEGIETLRVEYGVDTNDDLMVDLYRSATAVSDWSQVLSVRLALVVRGAEQDQGFTDSATYSLLPGENSIDFTPASANQHYPRKVFETTAYLRNQIRG